MEGKKQNPEISEKDTVDNKSDWIITPGLKDKVNSFIKIYQTVKKPIMITGHTGVGKSLFIQIYEQLYREENPDKTKKPFIRFNCAAIPKDLIESELFGHVKGAFTGATNNKKGLITLADGGVAVIEEIGELSHELQAKLLTFIEDGIFYEVGGINPTKTIVQIICTTNKGTTIEERNNGFRADFWYRFFIFTIPPLYQRRGDVLYYIENKYPDLIKSLESWEVLSLLAYNWPGNVRELENIFHYIKCEETNIIGYSSLYTLYLNKAASLSEWTSFNIWDAFNLYEQLKEGGIDVDLLEKILNKHGLGFGKFRPILLPLKKIKIKYNEKFNDQIKIKTIDENQLFRKAFIGFATLSLLTGNDYNANKNTLIVNKDKYPPPLLASTYYGRKMSLTNPQKSKLKKIETQIKSFCLKSSVDISNDDPFLLTEKELLKKYYETLIKKANGNKAEAARMAGIGKNTFYDRLKKHGIK